MYRGRGAGGGKNIGQMYEGTRQLVVHKEHWKKIGFYLKITSLIRRMGFKGYACKIPSLPPTESYLCIENRQKMLLLVI